MPKHRSILEREVYLLTCTYFESTIIGRRLVAVAHTT